MLKKSWRSDQQPMSAVEVAIQYARDCVNTESRGHGDVDDAMHRLAAKTGVGYWTWWSLWHRRRKEVDSDLLGVVRSAYLALCARQISAFQNRLEIEAQKDADGNVTDQDLLDEAARLLAKIKARQARLNGGGGR